LRSRGIMRNLRGFMGKETSLHLCQPGNGKSCGACCGIYNYTDSSREALGERLRVRTRLFRRDVREAGDLPDFSRAVRAAEDQNRRFEVIYCCEYTGFIDDDSLVGCLLHQGQNGGIDLRGASFYGAELCSGHLCPSNHFLSKTEKRIMIDLLDDWYLYGLCITDIDLIREYFRHISDRLGEAPAPERFREGRVRAIARRFFSFKLIWPYRSPEANRFGRFYFDGSQHMIRPIDYASFGCERSRFDGILLSLSSVLGSRQELRKAETMIQENIEEIVKAYEGRS
jgi:hypothetical protein